MSRKNGHRETMVHQEPSTTGVTSEHTSPPSPEGAEPESVPKDAPPPAPLAIPELAIHAVAKLFPEMTPTEYEAFKNDIAVGNRPTPNVWTHEGKIIDGRHGYRACRELGRVPEIREWNGEGSLLSFVIALNLNRRQLTSAQRACVATVIEAQLAKEAAARRRRGKAAETTQSVGEADEQNDRHAGEAAEQAARIAGTNRDYVAKAKKLRKHWPELFEQLRSGRVELPEADRTLRAALVELREQAPELHAKVTRGENTVSQAQTAAKRLAKKASPTPGTTRAMPGAPIVGSEPPESVNEPGGESASTRVTSEANADLTSESDPDDLKGNASVRAPAAPDVCDSGTSSAITEPEDFGPTRGTAPEQPRTPTGGPVNQDALERLSAIWQATNQPTRLAFLDLPAVRAATRRLEELRT